MCKSSTLVSAILLCIHFASVAAASEDLPSDEILVREGGTDYKVSFALEKGQMVLYANGEACGVGTSIDEWAHYTIPGNRHFKHIHVNYALPKKGVDEFMNERTATTTNIRAYWDEQYKGYEAEGSEELRRNCCGYAFVRLTWIQDATYIHQDELETVNTWQQTGYLTNGSVHVIKIIDYEGGTFSSSIRTSEQNGPSRIYTAWWHYTSPTTATEKRRNKQIP